MYYAFLHKPTTRERNCHLFKY